MSVSARRMAKLQVAATTAPSDSGEIGLSTKCRDASRGLRPACHRSPVRHAWRRADGSCPVHHALYGDHGDEHGAIS